MENYGCGRFETGLDALGRIVEPRVNELIAWLPIDFVLEESSAFVRLMEFGSVQPSDPFFVETLQRLRQMEPPAREAAVSMQRFLAASAALPRVEPAGIIFHVSRCGSTWVGNCLRSGVNSLVLSEMAAIGSLFDDAIVRAAPPIGITLLPRLRRVIADAVLAKYVQHASLDPTKAKIIIKWQAVGMLQIAMYRAVWPHVPFLILIRDPVEVIVSNLARPAKWLRSHLNMTRDWPIVGSSLAEVEDRDTHFCAQRIGQFYETACVHLDGNCMVVDYDELDLKALYRIAGFFGVVMPRADCEGIRAALAIYSKDPERLKPFVPDSSEKQAAATKAIRDAAAQWAERPYRALRYNKKSSGD